MQSTLDPRGPAAAEIANLWWVLLVVCCAALAVILALLLYAVYRDQRRRLAPRHHSLFVLGGGLLFPTISLIGLLIYGTEVGRRIVAEPDGPSLRIEVTGHRFWWEVRYPADGDAPEVTTANEVHLPVGVPVEIALRSADVIHSFWIPNLAGKLDMVPGHTNVIRLQADRAGESRGQCAEYCGVQHAHMAFGVVALSRAEFAAWREARAAQAAAPAQDDTATLEGLQAFVDSGCADCHRVSGAIPGSGGGDPATGIRGPDLTHVAARETLGARTLPYSRDNVALWIRGHGRLKPGNRMPDFGSLRDDTVEAIADYLDTLR